MKYIVYISKKLVTLVMPLHFFLKGHAFTHKNY